MSQQVFDQTTSDGDKSRRRQLSAAAARHLMDTLRTVMPDFQCLKNLQSFQCQETGLTETLTLRRALCRIT